MAKHLHEYLHSDPISGIYWVTVALLVLLGIYAAIHRMMYVADALILITFASLLFAHREKVLLSWEGVLLGCTGMLMNTVGVFGAYNITVHGIGWDKFLHLVMSAGIGLLIYAYLDRASRRASNPSFNPWELALFTFFLVLGVGALNEITEFMGVTYFGFSQGILGMANGSVVSNNSLERFDTQWDLITNAIGALVAVAYMTIKTSLVKRRT
jgi:hypothetical protein